MPGVVDFTANPFDYFFGLLAVLHRLRDACASLFDKYLRDSTTLANVEAAQLLKELFELASYVAEVVVPKGSATIGKKVNELDETVAEHGVEVIGLVRRGARRPMGSSTAGLVEELLSPDLTDDFEVVHSTFQPHSRITAPVTRPTQEVGYIVQGTLEIEINGTAHSLTPGDSFRIRGEPFRWANRSDQPAVAIWVIAPPVY